MEADLSPTKLLRQNLLTARVSLPCMLDLYVHQLSLKLHHKQKVLGALLQSQSI